MRRTLLGLVMLLLALALSLGRASAAPALIAVDDATPALTPEGDESFSGTIELTNLTGAALELTPSVPGRTMSCDLRLSKAAIGAAQGASVEVTASEDCGSSTSELAFVVTARAQGTSQALQITATIEDASEPKWEQLWAFAIALPMAALVVFLATASAGHRGWKDKLPQLEATYDFKESWVSNLTVLGGLLTALFGSAEVVKAFLGEDADRSIALATVGSAVALIFVGAAPVWLIALRSKHEHERVFTVGGLFLAATFAAAGAGGELWVGFRSGTALDLNGWEDRLWLPFAVAALLLVLYTFTTIVATIEVGTAAAQPPEKSDVAQLAALLKVMLIRADAAGEAIDDAEPRQQQEAMLRDAEAPRVAPVKGRRAALL